MSDAAQARYTVRGRWAGRNGSSNYLCKTVEQVFEVLEHFKKDHYTHVEVLATDGTVLSKADLISRQAQDAQDSGGGPVVPDALAAPIPLAVAA